MFKIMKLRSLFLILFCLILNQAHAALPNEFLQVIPRASKEYRNKLAQLAKKPGAKGDFFRLKMAEKLLKAGDTSGALKYTSRVKEPIFAFWKKVLSAEVFLAKNKNREAIALVKKLPMAPDYEMSYGEGLYQNLFKRALLVRFLARQALGQKTEADAADLIAYFPTHKAVLEILGEQNKNPPMTLKQKITKLHSLHQRYKYKKVPGLITASQIKSTSLSKEEKCRALSELGNALKFVKGQREASISGFQEVVKLNCSKKYLPRALYWLGSLKPSPTSSFPDQREKHLKRLHQDYPNHRLADDAFYKLYKIANSQNRSSEAQKHFKDLMARKKGDMKSSLLFDLAFPEYKKKNYKKAAQILSKGLETEATADENYPRLLYWYGRSLEKTENKKNKAIAKKTYDKLVSDFPYSFYAILGGKRVNKVVKKPQLPKLTGTPPLNNIEYITLIDDFNLNGYHEGANVVLDFALHLFPEWIDQHKEFITKKLIESRNYRKALDLAANHFDSGVYGPITGDTDPMFAAFYPMPFNKQTKIGYQKSKLPYGAIEGIMREESLFQRTVQSHVGATGLMQLMPGTAALVRKNHPELGIGTDLTDPLNNILLGSTYLRNMRKYFNNQLPLAIMAYNAGPGNVNKWLRKFGNLELDEFIENIPFRETKGYVKRVMRSMQVYGGLYREPFFAKPDYFNFEITRSEKQMPRKKSNKRKRRRRK